MITAELVQQTIDHYLRGDLNRTLAWLGTETTLGIEYDGTRPHETRWQALNHIVRARALILQEFRVGLGRETKRPSIPQSAKTGYGITMFHLKAAYELLKIDETDGEGSKEEAQEQPPPAESPEPPSV